MNKLKFKKVEEKISNKIESSIFSFKIFAEPRPNYIAKITFFDKLLSQTLLKLFPFFIRPNFLTILRIVSVPFVVFLLLVESYKLAFCLFIFSALTDALDGALARTRKQITDWGIVFDPLADKLLISSISIVAISKFISPILAGLIVTIEIFLVTSSYLRFKGEVVPAKTTGKVKMILQSVGVGLLLLSLIINSSALIVLSTYILYLSVFFAFLSLFVYRSI